MIGPLVDEKFRRQNTEALRMMQKRKIHPIDERI